MIHFPKWLYMVLKKMQKYIFIDVVKLQILLYFIPRNNLLESNAETLFQFSIWSAEIKVQFYDMEFFYIRVK